MSFVDDLNKAYDSIDRELLWKVYRPEPAYHSRLPQVIRHFHDGMLARVRVDDHHSRTGLSPRDCDKRMLVVTTCCSTSFVGAVEVMLKRFNWDDEEEGMYKLTETLPECVRRAACEIDAVR